MSDEPSCAEERRRNIAHLHKIADRFRWTATRVGDPGCRVRLEAADDEAAVRWAINALQRNNGAPND